MTKAAKSTNPTTPLVLAIDHGTSGIKAALVTVHGQVLDTTYQPTATSFLPGGGAEQDPDEWWNALLNTGRTLVDRAGTASRRVEAVAVSSTFSSTVAVDEDGRHLDNCLTWMDSRGAPYVKDLMRGFPSVAGYGLKSIMRWVPTTGGGPSLSGKDDIAHLLFWKHQKPDIYERAGKFLPSKDYLNARLTGIIAASFDSMTLFWVTDARDPYDIRYDDTLIQLAGLDREKLPPMMPSTDVLGPLLPEVARQLGLSTKVKVVAGSPDHQCAGIGAGSVLDYDGHLYIGTSSWLQCTVPFKKTDVLHSIASLPTAIPGRYYAANEQDMAGGCLALLGRLLFDQEPPGGLYATLDKLAKAASPGAGGLLFGPWLNGERTPVDDPNLRGMFSNLSNSVTRSDMARAVYEGVAYNTRWAAEHVERFVGRELDPVSIVGGGARSDFWCRLLADVLQRTLRRPTAPLQANARGAAFIAAVGLGHIGFQDIPGLMEYDATFRPDLAVAEIYTHQYRAFRRMHDSNKSFFHWLHSGGRP